MNRRAEVSIHVQHCAKSKMSARSALTQRDLGLAAGFPELYAVTRYTKLCRHGRLSQRGGLEICLLLVVIMVQRSTTLGVPHFFAVLIFVGITSVCVGVIIPSNTCREIKSSDRNDQHSA
jgi:hypothetical protein